MSRNRPARKSRSHRRCSFSAVLICAFHSAKRQVGQSTGERMPQLQRRRARTRLIRECSPRSLVRERMRAAGAAGAPVGICACVPSLTKFRRGCGPARDERNAACAKATPSAPRLAVPASSMCSPLERVVQWNGAETTPWSLGAPQVLQRPRRDRARSQARSGRRTVSIVAILPLELLIHTLDCVLERMPSAPDRLGSSPQARTVFRRLPES